MTHVLYRPADQAEVAGFVIPTFLDSFRACRAAGLISMQDWYAVMRPQASRLFGRPGVATLVACHPGEPTLYGWLALERGWEMPFVLYCYVKAPYRRAVRLGYPEGIATGLFRAAGIDQRRAFCYAAYTPFVKRLEDKIPRATWTPLRARFPPPQEEKKHVIVEQRRCGAQAHPGSGALLAGGRPPG